MKDCNICCAFLLMCFSLGGFTDALSAQIATFAQAKHTENTLHAPSALARANSEDQSRGDPPNAKCLRRENGVCTACGIDVATSINVSNKTRTALLICRGMKAGPARLVMVTHAEPVIAGPWEVEFGLGYHTSAKEECPHQFIASNNPPIRPGYEIGPISIDGEIPADGIVHALVCVGLSSARVENEGKETPASLKITTLKVISLRPINHS